MPFTTVGLLGWYFVTVFTSSPLFLYILLSIQVEFTFPPIGKSQDTKLPSEWRFLPFLALPDGAHNCEQGARIISVRHCGFRMQGHIMQGYFVRCFSKKKAHFEGEIFWELRTDCFIYYSI